MADCRNKASLHQCVMLTTMFFCFYEIICTGVKYHDYGSMVQYTTHVYMWQHGVYEENIHNKMKESTFH